MAQTVEELAELLDNIKLEVERNMDGFDKVLNTINNKLDLISNDTEADDLIKVYLTELKKLLEERHALISEEFTNIKNSSQTIISEQSNMVKTSQMQDMFDIFTTNMQSVAQELFIQKDLLAQYEENFSKYTSDKTDKNDIINSVAAIKNDIDHINQKFLVSITEIGSNIQSIFKNLIVMDPSAQNDVVKRELENIYLSSNAILSTLHTVEQKNDDIINYFDTLITREDFEKSQDKIDSILSKTDIFYENSQDLLKKDDLSEINESIEVLSQNLDNLKENFVSSDENINSVINDQFMSLKNSLSTVVTGQDFEGFKNNLADFVQKIIDNSAGINENVNLNRSVLDNLMFKIQNMDFTQNFEEITKAFSEIQFITQENADKIIERIKAVTSELNSHLDEVVENKIDDLGEKLQVNYAETKKSLDAMKTESATKAEQIIEGIANVSKRLDDIPVVSLEDKIDYINEKVIITSQDLKILQDKVLENLSNDQSENFDVINHNIDVLKESIVESTNMRESSLIERLIALRDMINENAISNYENLDSIKEALSINIINIEKIAQEADDKLLFSLNEIKEIKLDVDKIINQIAEIDNSQENRASNLVSVISTELNNLVSSIGMLQESIQTGLHQEFITSTQSIENQINTLIKEIEDLNKEFDNSEEQEYFDKSFKEIKDKITAVKQEVNLVNTDMLEIITSKTEALMQEMAPLKNVLSALEELKNNNKFRETLVNKDDFDVLIKKIFEIADDIKNTIFLSLNADFSNESDLKIKEQLDILNQKVDVLAMVDNSEGNLEIVDNITKGNNKIVKLLDVINQKVDVLAMSDYSEDNSEILDEINDIKIMISSQRNLIEKTVNSDNANAIEMRLEELIEKINSIDSSKDIKDVRESLLTTILNVFEQISFIEESEDIKDFVEEKTEAINQSLIEVKQQLKQITNNDEGYSYTLQDVESDIAKLRLVIKEFSNTTSTEEISDISDNIHRIVSSVENIQTSLTQEQVSYLRENFEKLSDDVLSISSRTNKLLLTSDESYNALNNGLNDFSNVICKLEERLNYLDNKEITERIEQKLDNTLNLVTESTNSDKVMRQALIYMGEWIDNTSENIQNLHNEVQKIENIQEILENYEHKIQEQGEVINSICEKFDEQQERIDQLEQTLEKILSAIDDIDDTKLQKKVDKIDKQLTQLSGSIEKLMSYVDE